MTTMHRLSSHLRRLPASLLGIAFLLVASQLLPIPVRAADRLARDRIQVLYSGEDRLCSPFRDLLNKLHARYPKALYLSEVRAAVFRGTGLHPVHWIERPDPALAEFPEHTPGSFFRANVTGEGQQRVAYVREFALGHHGGYTTEVWIFKPGAGYRQKRGLDPSRNEMVTDVDPEAVDLLVAFSERPPWWPFQYPYVRGPDHRIGFPTTPPPSEDAKKFLRLWFSGRQAQEAFSFGGRIYFYAGLPLRGVSLVYRITSGLAAEAVCLTTTLGGLNESKKLQ